MKKETGGDIIIIEVKFDMERNDFLLSTAMLSSIWEEKQCDSIDMLVEYAKYIIGANTKQGNELNLELIHERIKSGFLIRSLPQQVLEVVLLRLTKKKYGSILQFDKKTHKYILNIDLSQFVVTFESKITLQKTKIFNVFEELEKYYNGRARKPLSTEELKRHFIRFIRQEGYDFLRSAETPNSLRKITSRKSQCDYLIAQFILDTQSNREELYKSILKMTAGYFLAQSIYLDSSRNNFKKNPPLKDLRVYIDTTLLLYILDCKTEYQHQSVMSMVNILLENGASLYYYPHNLEEVQDIIIKYKNNRHRCNSYRTLEKFDKEEYSDVQIDIFYESIEELLSKTNIFLEDTQPYDSYSDVIDEKGLSEFLSERIAGYKEKDNLLKHDVQSIASICMERKGVKVDKYENLTCIWVTSNTSLVKHTNHFLENDYKGSISPLISDRKLTTDLWVKYGNKKDNIFELYLLENALLAIEPSEEILERFFENVERFEKMNVITPELAAFLRIKCISDKNLMIATEGDPDNLTEETANDYINLCKQSILKDYTQEKENEISILKTDVALQLKNKDDEIVTLKRTHDLDKQKSNKKISELEASLKRKEEQSLVNISSKSKRSAAKVCTFLKWIYYAFLLLAAIGFSANSAKEIYEAINGNTNIFSLVSSIAASVIGIVFIIADFMGLLSFTTKLKLKICHFFERKFYDRYYRQYEQIVNPPEE